MQGALDAIAAPLDRGRARLLRAAVRAPSLRRIVGRRDARVAAQASVGVLVALALTIAAPVLLFSVSPLVFGVAHVASDVRYLLLRPRLPRAWLFGSALACSALVGVRAASLLGAPVPAVLVEGAVAFGWMLAGVVAGAAVSGSTRRARWMVPAVLALAALAAFRPGLTQIVFLHLHNVVALALWALLFRRRALFVLAPIGAVLGGAALLALGASIPWTAGLGGLAFGGLDLGGLGARVAPGAPAELGARLALLFVFLQAVHYAVWLGWIPQEEIRGEGPLTFRQSFRALARDLRPPGLALTVVATLAFLALAFFDLHRARGLYLSLANFHGLLEVATLCFFVSAGSRPSRPPGRS